MWWAVYQIYQMRSWSPLCLTAWSPQLRRPRHCWLLWCSSLGVVRWRWQVFSSRFSSLLELLAGSPWNWLAALVWVYWCHAADCGPRWLRGVQSTCKSTCLGEGVLVSFGRMAWSNASPRSDACNPKQSSSGVSQISLMRGVLKWSRIYLNMNIINHFELVEMMAKVICYVMG